MGNYSSKLFHNNILNDIKIKEHNHSTQEQQITSEQVPQSGEKPNNSLENDQIVQTPIKKNRIAESRKRTNAIPEYLQTEKTRKPYLETDLDSVSTNGKLNWLDPRSPNVAYPRTPILLQNKSDLSTKNVDDENFSNLKLQSPEIQTNEIVLDPRSPASDFDRTPISAIRVSKQFNSQGSDTVNRLRKSNSSLDICIKLSYCETTSLFNIPEIQALPDIVVSLRRSCSLKDNLNEKSSSLSSGKVNLKPELVSDDLQTLKLHVSSGSTTPNVEGEIVSKKPADADKIETNEKSVKINSNNLVSKNNTDPPKNVENLHNTDPEEKFKVWRDSYSNLPEMSCTGNPNNFQRNSSLPDKEEILIEFDDYSVMNSMRSNEVKKMEKTEESTKEKRVKSVDKKALETKKEIKLLDDKKLFDPEFKPAIELSKNRTPFSNRSNNNGHIQALSAKSPQRFLGHRKLFSENKNLQENTPPAHKKKVKNVPTKLNSTQWDSESTIII